MVPRRHIIGPVPTHVLVTGGAGFIGSHSVRALVERGARVRVLDALRPPVHAPGRSPDLPTGVELVAGEVEDRAVLRRALDGVDAVLHLAAYQDYLPDFSTFYRVNAVGTALLYELIVAERLPVGRVVVAATQAEYGEGKYRCAEHGVLYPPPREEAQLAARDWEVRCPNCRGPLEPLPTDEAVVNPGSTYAMSKRAAEELALTLGRRYGIPTATMRYSIVQGPGQSFRNAYSGALRAFAVQALHGRPPLVYEDGQQLRDFVWIGDVVAANVLMLTRDRIEDGAYNVGGDRRVRVIELARMVLRAVGLDGEPAVPGVYRVGDTRHIQSDVGRLRGLGWAPTTAQTDMVRAYVDWARRQPDLYDSSAEAVARMRRLGVLKEAR
jgi:dTDP-L-rhamnose 4-epimerase